MNGEIFRDDGKSGLAFIGDFEGLYQQSVDPWGQSGTRQDNADYYRFSRMRLASSLYGQCGKSIGHGLEIGCGYGYSMSAVAKWVPGNWTGIDISRTALARARQLFPAHSFHAGDIRGELPLPPSSLGKFDATIISQMLWYILDKIDPAIANAIRLTRLGGLIAIQQAFLREQIYGREIIDGFAGALRYLCGRFPQLVLIEARYDDSERHPHHDGLLIFRKVAHA